MRYQHIIQAVFHEPWLITQEAHAAIRQIVKAHLLKNDGELKRADGTGMCGEAVEVDQMIIQDGVAHIPVGGVIARKVGAMERGAGVVDSIDIANDLAEAEASPEVELILLDIDSPGGMFNGTPELAARLAAVTKDCYTFSVGDICSGAYWLGAATRGIFTTPSADIGSIGVYIPWEDLSGMYEKEGIKVELFKDGKYKGMGYPGTSLTAEQRTHLQDRVGQISATFKGFVRDRRGEISDETMQGQTFLAPDALTRGLIDGIVADKWELLAMVR